MAEWIVKDVVAPLGYTYLDVVHRQELIRCKDCKHWKDKTCYDTIIPHPEPNGEWFCADGRKKNGQERRKRNE